MTNLDKVRVYINSPNQMLLTPTSIYGSAGWVKYIILTLTLIF